MNSDANKNKLENILQLALTFSINMTENTVTFSHLEVAIGQGHKSWGASLC